MATALTLIGIGCIIAAIVGGGIKIKDVIEFGTVSSFWRQFLLAGFGLLLLALGSDQNPVGSSRIAGDPDQATDSLASPEQQVPRETAPHAEPPAEAALTSRPVDPAVAPSADTAPPVDVAPAAGGGVGSPYLGAQQGTLPLTVWNMCPEGLTMWLAHQAPSGWTDNGGTPWLFAPFERSRLALNNVPLVLTSGEIYVYARSMIRGAEWSGPYTIGSLRGLRRFDVVPSEGEYLLPLSC